MEAYYTLGEPRTRGSEPSETTAPPKHPTEHGHEHEVTAAGNNSDSENSDGDSGATVGIVISSILGVGFLALVLYCFFCRGDSKGGSNKSGNKSGKSGKSKSNKSKKGKSTKSSKKSAK